MEETRMLKRQTIQTGNNQKCLELPILTILTIRTILTPKYPKFQKYLKNTICSVDNQKCLKVSFWPFSPF